MSYPSPHPQQFPIGPPAFGPPPRKKSKTPLILAIVGGALALCCGGTAVLAVVGGQTPVEPAVAEAPKAAAAEPVPTEAAKAPAKVTTTKPPVPAAPAAPAKKQGPGMNDAVRDGKFEFVVTKLDCGRTKVGSEYFNQKAQGKFCMVSVKVKNIGDEAQLFSGSSQKALDAKGTEYSNDTSAELYANEDNNTFLTEINPGNQVSGRLIFDVPKATKLTVIDLHDSPFSGGVEVSLS